MGDFKFIFVLIIIVGVLAVLSMNYTEWTGKKQLADSPEACEVEYAINPLTQEKYVSGMSCPGDVPVWFNLTWIVPVTLTFGYILVKALPWT